MPDTTGKYSGEDVLGLGTTGGADTFVIPLYSISGIFADTCRA
jgi:hypothetical protein